MKFLKNFETINHINTYLFDNFLIKSKEKKFIKRIEYFQKYLYALDGELKVEVSNNQDRYVWQLWLQGETNMPPVVKKCTESVKKYCSDKRVVLLTKDNLSDYISLPDFIVDKYKSGIIPNAHYSDIIRLFLLTQYGGIWIDSTVLLTDYLSKNITESNFFVFKTINGLLLNKDVLLEQFKLLGNSINKPCHLSSSWFIYSAKPDNRIINNILKMELEYWKNENRLIDYFAFHYFFALAVLADDVARDEFLKMPSVSNVETHLLQRSLFEHFDALMYENILKTTSIHKLTHKNLDKDVYSDSVLKYLLKN